MKIYLVILSLISMALVYSALPPTTSTNFVFKVLAKRHFISVKNLISFVGDGSCPACSASLAIVKSDQTAKIYVNTTGNPLVVVARNGGYIYPDRSENTKSRVSTFNTAPGDMVVVFFPLTGTGKIYADLKPFTRYLLNISKDNKYKTEDLTKSIFLNDQSPYVIASVEDTPECL